MSARGAAWGIVFALAAMALAHFTSAPVTDFCSDDWGILARSQTLASPAAALSEILKDPDRPLGAGFLRFFFKVYDDRPALYAATSFTFNALFLIIVMLFIRRATRSNYAMVLGGLCFAVLPNLTESFHWYTMALYSPGYIGYALSALSWLRWIEGGSTSWALGAAAAYGVGIGTYEFGIALPFLYFLAPGPRSVRDRCLALVPLLAVLAFYLVWRFTQGFGTAHGTLFAPRKVEISAFYLLWNLREVVRWWVGSNMLTAVINGFEGFTRVASGCQWQLIGLDLVTVVTASVYAAQRGRCPDDDIVPGPAAWKWAFFGLAWMAATNLTSLISWATARQNYLPAVGASLFIAVWLARTCPRRWVPLAALAMFIALVADQGTANQWREAGAFQRNLFTHLASTREQWQDRKMVLVDTSRLRAQQGASLKAVAPEDARTWAYHGNASLLRGFVPEGMIRILSGERAPPMTILDVEHHARVDGDTLFWCARWNFNATNSTPMSDVFVVNALDASHGDSLK